MPIPDLKATVGYVVDKIGNFPVKSADKGFAVSDKNGDSQTEHKKADLMSGLFVCAAL